MQDTDRAEKLMEMKFHRGSEYNLEEIAIFGATLPQLSAVEPDVEADIKNHKERDHPHEPNHNHTIVDTHEYAENSSDCDTVEKSKLANGCSILSTEERKKKVKKLSSAIKQRTQFSMENEAREKAPSDQNSQSRRESPAKNGGSTIIQQKRCIEEEMNKSISPDIVSCAQSSIPSTNRRNSTGRVRMLCGMYSSSSSASRICSDCDLDPIDERKRNKLLGKKSQKNELIGDFRIFKTPWNKNPEGIHQKRKENVGKIKSIQEAAFKSDESDSSSYSASSSIYSHSKMDRIIKRNSHKSLDAKSRKKQNELMEDLRISKNRNTDNPGCVHQKTQKSEEMRNGLTGETYNGAHSTTPTTSSINSEGRIRKSCMFDSTCTSVSSYNDRINELDPIDERSRHTFLGKESLKKQNELMYVLPICKTRCSDNPGSIQQKTEIFFEKSKGISGETASDIQPPIPSTSSGNYEGIAIMENRTFTSATSNIFSSPELDPELENCADRKIMSCHEDTPSDSYTDESPETARLVYLEKHKLKEREHRKTEKALMTELRLLIPADFMIHPKASKAEILRFATKYIVMFKQNLDTKQKSIKDSRNEIESLKQEIENVMLDIHNIPKI